MISIRGIYYDLNESSYTFKYDNLTFYFSSPKYLERFKDTYIEYIKNETMKLNLKFSSIVYADEMLLLNLYKQIEKRGFKVLYKNKELINNYFIDCVINEEQSLK